MTSESGSSQAEVVLQRIVLPWDVELPAPMADLLPLYASTRGVRRPAGTRGDDAPPDSQTVSTSQHFRVEGRQHVRIEPFSRVTFDTYFNRLHAGYYTRWTRAGAYTLRVSGEGRGRVTVRRSTREGRLVVDHVEIVELGPTTPFEWTINASVFTGGGAAWFEVESFDAPILIGPAEWVAVVDSVVEPVIDIAICTFNRPRDVAKLLKTLHADPEFSAHIGTIWVADNGTSSFLDVPGGVESAGSWGDRLQIINQPNLGGSGGFSRGMYESVRKGAADYVFLMDDDALAEPESLRRAMVFAEIAARPLAVGGQMLLRGKPLELHTSGERVDGRTFRWGAAPLGRESIQLAAEPLDTVVDVGYNGWWLCLIPTAVVRELGLAQPFFIKWDDAEYGMRMAQAGYPTVTLPGVATWHESWELKDDTTDWTLYFHIRNRLISAAMLSAGLPEEIARRRFSTIVTDVLKQDVFRNVSRRAFATVDAATQAMDDFLKGPHILEQPLDELVAEVRMNRKRYPGDETVEVLTSEARLPGDPKPRRKASLAFPVALAREYGLRAPRVFLPIPIPPSLLKRKPVADEWEIWRLPVDRGPVPLPKDADTWWGVANHPDAAVVSIDGSKVLRRTRDPQAARELTKRALDLARRIVKEGPTLVDAYGEARHRFAQPEAWERQWVAPLEAAGDVEGGEPQGE